MAYATVEDVQARMMRQLSPDEQSVAQTLLDDSAVLIDSYKSKAPSTVKGVVSCRMVVRALGDGQDNGVPMGATQGSVSALGYAQSWTIGSGGGFGDLYISKVEKQMLGVGNSIGSYSPTQELVGDPICEA